ncbi:hypothetical protein P692DRAFT_20837094 [Suillus brevipes Sb2]|nr:hypothetical protein P692DRAFT_20837094 [Suillus brevipes Sb2]
MNDELSVSIFRSGVACELFEILHDIPAALSAVIPTFLVRSKKPSLVTERMLVARPLNHESPC